MPPYHALLSLSILAIGAVSGQNASAPKGPMPPASGTTEPCAKASQEVTARDGKIDASVAMQCLQSVPVDKAGDIVQIKGLQAMLEFQSNLNYLKAPPPGYLYPPTDLLSSLDDIASAVEDDAYGSEYDVQADILALINSAHDVHLVYDADIMNVFSFTRTRGLISLSEDGKALPNIYAAADVLVLAAATAFTASPITEIDGLDVEQWLNLEATSNPFGHDPDANYNNQLLSVPNLSLVGGDGRNGFLYPRKRYPGAYTTITFANGTTINDTNSATTNVDWSGVTDGQSFFRKFCAPASTTGARITNSSTVANDSSALIANRAVSSAVISSTVAASTVNAYSALPTSQREPAPKYYPMPVVRAADGSIGGFFPDEKPDLAVVAVPDFGPDNIYEFGNTFRTFLATAKAAGKSKLLIDLRSNGGGQVLVAYDMFKQLFPSKTPYGLQDIAANDLLRAMGTVASRLVGEGSLTDADLQPLTQIDYRMSLSEDLSSYPSWPGFFGPVARDGGEFTNLLRYNLSDDQSLGTPIYGYRNDTRPQPQTFAEEDIVILSDGICASTCAVFAEFMKSQANVQVVVIGGRKQVGPMQWVGGTKGSQNQRLPILIERAQETYAQANEQEVALFRPFIESGTAEAVNQTLARLGPEPAGGVNFQNNYRQGNDELVPLQFVYEAADCRLFYTAELVARQSLICEEVYDVRWGNGACVEGSTGQPSSVSGSGGDGVAYVDGCPPEGAAEEVGADATLDVPGAESSSVPCKADNTTAGGSGASDGEAQAPENSAAAKFGIGMVSRYVVAIGALVCLL